MNTLLGIYLPKFYKNESRKFYFFHLEYMDALDWFRLLDHHKNRYSFIFPLKSASRHTANGKETRHVAMPDHVHLLHCHGGSMSF